MSYWAVRVDESICSVTRHYETSDEVEQRIVQNGPAGRWVILDSSVNELVRYQVVPTEDEIKT